MALNEDEIRRKLGSAEDHFVERKRNPNAAEIRKTLVAFANSTPEGNHGILFIGIDDDGVAIGADGTDSLQKTVRDAAENDCYPAIKCTSVVLQENGRSIVAVVVESSKNKPHFAGPAFVRRGSQTIKASPEVYDELIASRNDKARRIIAEKGNYVSLEWKGWKTALGAAINETITPPESRQYRVNSCDAHCVEIEDLTFGKLHNFPLERVLIGSVREIPRLRLVILG